MKIRDLLALARIQLRREDGQTMTEYGVLLALIALAVIVAITALGGALNGVFNGIVSGI
jgi:pilus assembly protein Flp/PilA